MSGSLLQTALLNDRTGIRKSKNSVYFKITFFLKPQFRQIRFPFPV